MRLRKRCCYYCICGYPKKKKPLKVYCTAISDYVEPNGICNVFKKKNKTMTTIKKIILLALTALMTVGCDHNSNRNIDTKTEGTLYGTIIIDSCEYIRAYSRLAHKGNCRFCKERRQKELEELVTKLKEK